MFKRMMTLSESEAARVIASLMEGTSTFEGSKLIYCWHPCIFGTLCTNLKKLHFFQCRSQGQEGTPKAYQEGHVHYRCRDPC